MKKTNKLTAIISTACIAVSSLTVPAYATDTSGSFKEELGKIYDEQIDRFSKSYADNYNRLDGPISTDADITLTPGEGAFALLGTTGLDMSWLNNLKLSVKEQGLDDKIYAFADVNVNDKTVISAEELYDLASQICYYSFPDIIDQNLSVDMNKIISASKEASELKDIFSQNITDSNSEADVSDDMVEDIPNNINMKDSLEFNVDLMKVLTSIHSIKDMQDYLPEPEIVSSIIDRYSDIVIDHFEDLYAEPSMVSAGSVQVDAMAYTGKMGNEELISLITDIITSAQDDKDIEALFDKYSQINSEISYDEFIATLQDTLYDISEVDSKDLEDINLVITIYKNTNDEVIGLSGSISVDGEDFKFTINNPNDGKKSALDVLITLPAEIDSGISSITVQGEGDINDGAVTGDYIIAVNGTNVADINAKYVSYDKESGSCSGSLDITPIVPENTDDYQMSMLGMFSFQTSWDFTSDNMMCDISLLMSGTNVATVSINTSNNKDDNIIIPEVSDFEPAVDILNEEDTQNILSTIDPTSVFENLIDAGMPEDFIEQVSSLMSGGAASESEVSLD